MAEHFYAVIMAGGGGTRLWPLSRKSQPKQMLKIGSDRTLFQLAIDRLEDVIPFKNILVVTVAEQAERLRSQVPEIPAENFILEPMPRGTASVVGLAAVAIQQRDPHPETSMAVLTADHYIGNVPRFKEVITAANELAARGYLVTLGIEPTSPSSAYGYIQRGGWIDTIHGMDTFKVEKFTEKPAAEQARIMLARGGYSWNSGMFIWRIEILMDKIRQFLPHLAARLDQIALSWDTPGWSRILEQVWPGIQKETIDYGIMEKSSDTAVIPADNLGWYDVGSWDSLFEMLSPDADGNIAVDAEHISLDTKDTLVVGENLNKPVVTLGLRNMVIVETPQALLVCPKEEAQKVRAIIDLLKQMGREDLL